MGRQISNITLILLGCIQPCISCTPINVMYLLLAWEGILVCVCLPLYINFWGVDNYYIAEIFHGAEVSPSPGTFVFQKYSME